MRPTILFCFAALALWLQPLLAAAQPAPTDAPEPKMPPMPSMEGQQGDVSKPITQIPPRKKAPAGAPKAALAPVAAKPSGSRPPAARTGAAKPRAAKSRAARSRAPRGRHRR